MKLRIYLVLFLQVALVKCLQNISGFLGDSVTLPSGVDTSWKLSSIEWSIFLNGTWIATYRKKEKNLDRLDRYKGRLGLNISTGDLTIHNLTSEDALQYTVDLSNGTGQRTQNKVAVRVMKPLQKPTVEAFESKSNKCHWSVRCQSPDKGVLLSWEATPPAVTSSYNLTNADGLSVAVLNFNDSTQRQVVVTCISQRGAGRTSSNVTLTCRGDELKPTPSPTPPPTPLPEGRTRYVAVFFLGVVLTGSLWVFTCYRRNI